MARLLILPLLDETSKDNRNDGSYYHSWEKQNYKSIIRPLYLNGINHFPNDDYLQPIHVGQHTRFRIEIDGKLYKYNESAVIDLNLEKGIHRIEIFWEHSLYEFKLYEEKIVKDSRIYAKTSYNIYLREGDNFLLATLKYKIIALEKPGSQKGMWDGYNRWIEDPNSKEIWYYVFENSYSSFSSGIVSYDEFIKHLYPKGRFEIDGVSIPKVAPDYSMNSSNIRINMNNSNVTISDYSYDYLNDESGLDVKEVTGNKSTQQNQNTNISLNPVKKEVVEVKKELKFYEKQDFLNKLEGFEYSIENDEVTVYYITNKKSHVIIPNGVSYVKGQIGSYSYDLAESITKITMADSVKVIDSLSFNNLPNLKEVEIGKGIKTIPYGAFFMCGKLEKIIIPNTVKEIEECAFEKCSALKEVVVPQGCKIANNVFESSTKIYYGEKGNVLDLSKKVNLGDYEAVGDTLIKYIGNDRELVIPKGITVIGEGAFKNNANIETVIFSEKDIELKKSSFEGCPNLKKVIFNDSANHIKEFAFKDCRSLERIENLNKIKSFGIYAFSGCQSLTEFKIPKIEEYHFNNGELSEGLFYDCKSLSSVLGLENVFAICKDTFGNCVSLTSLTFEKCYFIFPHAFEGCINLEYLCFGNAKRPPEFELDLGYDRLYKLKHIHYCALKKDIENKNSINKLCKLCKVTFGAVKEEKIKIDKKPEDAFSHKLKEFLSHFKYEIGKTEIILVEMIDDELVDIKIPKQVTFIRKECFKNKLIRSVEMHDGVYAIEDGAFEGCKCLEKITFSNSLTSFSKDMCLNCESLNKIDIPNSVENIYSHAFEGTSLTEITIPEKVKNIGFGSFNTKGTLLNVNVSENNPYLKVYNNMLFRVSSTPYDTSFFKVKVKGRLLLYPNGRKDKFVDLSDLPFEINEINNFAFANATYLEKIKGNKKIYVIRDGAFYNCVNLKEVVFFPKLLIILSHAFENCSNLSYVEFGKKVKSIHSFSFNNCFKLKNVTIHRKTEFYDRTFVDGCKVKRKCFGFKSKENV